MIPMLGESPRGLESLVGRLAGRPSPGAPPPRPGQCQANRDAANLTIPELRDAPVPAEILKCALPR